MPDTSLGGPSRDWPLTHWTAILAAKQGTDEHRTALGEVSATCWKPLYAYARRKGLDVERAKDAVQGVFALLIERDFLAKLDPARGKLRGYLKAAMDHYLINEHEKAVASKRGGGAAVLSLDVEGMEEAIGAMPAAPEAAFDREWAVGVMERATERLRMEFEGGKRGGPFALVERFLGFGAVPAYADAAKEAGMTVGQLKAFLHRSRARFRELVRDEVAKTCADVDAEMGALMEALAR